MKKRGQVTLFIILGIVLLLLISIILFLYQSQRTRPEVIEPEFIPIKNYVEECIGVVTEEALDLLGTQGGYVEIPREIELDPNSYISFGNGIVKVPFWYYLGTDRMPFLYKDEGSPSIQGQLENYITENIEICLDDFSVFEEQFTIKPSRRVSSEVEIGDESIIVGVEYPVKIKASVENKVGYVTKYQKIIPVQLKQMYELAKNIMEEENDKMYFENMTLDLMSMMPSIPFSGLEFHCGKKLWYLSNIKDELQSVLYYNIPLIRIYNTDYVPFIEQPSTYEDLRKYTVEDFFNGNYPDEPPPEDAYEYFHYFWDVRIPKNDLDVGFLYLPEWDMNIQAYPSDNGVLESNVARGAKQFLSFMCINLYHFTYDVEYPVQVIIRDDSAFFETGYTFQFAFPVLIEHNIGNREKVGSILFESLIPFTGYCDDLDGPFYDIRVTGTDEYGLTGVELNDVNISYNCLKFRCYLGQTKPVSGVYKLETQLPSSCAHGYITAEKEGYLKGDTQVLDSTDIDVTIRRLKKFNFTIVTNKYHGGVIDKDEEFANNMIAYFTLQSYEEPTLLMYKQFPFAEDATEEEMSITLIEENSKYKLDILLIDMEDELIIGGYRGNWTVSFNDMQGNNEVLFHVIEYLPKPMEAEAQYEMLQFLDQNQDYINRLKPEFRVKE